MPKIIKKDRVECSMHQNFAFNSYSIEKWLLFADSHRRQITTHQHVPSKMKSNNFRTKLAELWYIPVLFASFFQFRSRIIILITILIRNWLIEIRKFWNRNLQFRYFYLCFWIDLIEFVAQFFSVANPFPFRRSY